MTAGYSKTPLVKKLGIKPGFRVHFRRPPDELESNLGPLPREVEVKQTLRGSFDFIHVFETRRRELSWPKKSSGQQTDLSGGEARSIGLDHGLVDIKVCAVDEIWSGLKFVFRKADR